MVVGDLRFVTHEHLIQLDYVGILDAKLIARTVAAHDDLLRHHSLLAHGGVSSRLFLVYGMESKSTHWPPWNTSICVIG
jgi:hypothetical protein